MMRVLAAILILPLSATAIAEERTAPPLAQRPDLNRSLDRCGAGNDLAQYRKDHGLRVEKLGEMPPAADILALYRTLDGCPAPVVLRKGIGANPDKQLPISGGAEIVAIRP